MYINIYTCTTPGWNVGTKILYPTVYPPGFQQRLNVSLLTLYVIRLGYTLVEIFIYERKFETIVTPLRSILYTYRQHRCIHVIIV